MAKENNRGPGEQEHWEQPNVNKMKSVERTRRKGIMAKKNEHFEKEHWNHILKTGGKT